MLCSRGWLLCTALEAPGISYSTETAWWGQLLYRAVGLRGLCGPPGGLQQQTGTQPIQVFLGRGEAAWCTSDFLLIPGCNHQWSTNECQGPPTPTFSPTSKNVSGSADTDGSESLGTFPPYITAFNAFSMKWALLPTPYSQVSKLFTSLETSCASVHKYQETVEIPMEFIKMPIQTQRQHQDATFNFSLLKTQAQTWVLAKANAKTGNKDISPVSILNVVQNLEQHCSDNSL